MSCSTGAEISPRALEASIAVCHTKAQQLLNELREIINLLPDDDSVYGCVRGELEAAEDYFWPALDYLTPRADDKDPDECCAHRALRRAIDARNSPT